jgi:hypothetical protein
MTGSETSVSNHKVPQGVLGARAWGLQGAGETHKAGDSSGAALGNAHFVVVVIVVIQVLVVAMFSAHRTTRQTA